ncbi:hypothetical protein TRVL_09049 [Trypanosoma vivax]|nr:hypothetical protein TRVL_09049 [Trypanosoma vivax]
MALRYAAQTAAHMMCEHRLLTLPCTAVPALGDRQCLTHRMLLRCGHCCAMPERTVWPQLTVLRPTCNTAPLPERLSHLCAATYDTFHYVVLYLRRSTVAPIHTNKGITPLVVHS